MGIEELGLQLYRQTVKRLRPAHVASHWFMTHAIIPTLERAKNFKTIPDDPFWFRLELLRDKHEPETTQLFEQIVKPGMTVLDIGAHVGYYSRKFSEKVGKNGRIISFEPHPKTYQTLQRNIDHLSNITSFQIALAEKEGQAELHDYLVMSASGSLNYDPSIEDLQKSIQSKQDVAPRLSDDFEPKTYIVKTRPVDDCLADLNIETVDLIKMDIEGAELGALRGMRQTIQRSPNLMLVMEYNPQALQGFGHDPVSALFEVMEMGFSSLQAIEPDGRLTNLTLDKARLEEITDPLMKEMGVLNVFLQK